MEKMNRYNGYIYLDEVEHSNHKKYLKIKIQIFVFVSAFILSAFIFFCDLGIEQYQNTISHSVYEQHLKYEDRMDFGKENAVSVHNDDGSVIIVVKR